MVMVDDDYIQHRNQIHNPNQKNGAVPIEPQSGRNEITVGKEDSTEGGLDNIASTATSGITPNMSDVLCGRGSGVNSSPGNVFFRGLVRARKELYKRVKRHEKIPISEEIIDIIHNLDPPGRFLVRDGNTWKEYSHEQAMVKTAQALREGATKPERRPKPMTTSNISISSKSVSDDSEATPTQHMEAENNRNCYDAPFQNNRLYYGKSNHFQNKNTNKINQHLSMCTQPSFSANGANHGSTPPTFQHPYQHLPPHAHVHRTSQQHNPVFVSKRAQTPSYYGDSASPTNRLHTAENGNNVNGIPITFNNNYHEKLYSSKHNNSIERNLSNGTNIGSSSSISSSVNSNDINKHENIPSKWNSSTLKSETNKELMAAYNRAALDKTLSVDTSRFDDAEEDIETSLMVFFKSVRMQRCLMHQ